MEWCRSAVEVERTMHIVYLPTQLSAFNHPI
jgi:hypothetical protein